MRRTLDFFRRLDASDPAITARRAWAGWAIADVGVWDDEGRYLAHRAQAMFLRGAAGELPVVEPRTADMSATVIDLV